jgi:hypothetical protein
MPSYTLTYNTQLTEDFIHAESILASSTAANPIATFLNSSNQSEALVIHDDGELCHLQREPLSSSGWNIIGIGAQVATISAANSGNVWITDYDQNIWMSNAGHWNLIQNLPGGNQQISVLTDGTIYGTAQQNGQYVLYAYDPASASFVQQQLVLYSSSPVGSTGNLWSLDDNSAIVATDGVEGWTVFQSQPSNTPVQMFVSADQAVWALCDSNTLYTLDSDGIDWDQLKVPEDMLGFAPVNANQFYALSRAQSDATTLYSCDGNGNNTSVPQPTGRPLNGISVGMDGSLWGLDTIGTVWRYADSTWIRQIQPTDLSGTTGGLSVSEVVTGRHAMGQQYAFYVIDEDLYWSVFQEQEGVFGGYWTPRASVYSGISNIGVVNDPTDDSNLMVYGLNSNGDFVLVQNVEGTWTAGEHSMKTSLSGPQQYFNCGGQWVTCAVVNGDLVIGAPADKLAKVDGLPTLASVIPFATNPQGISASLLAVLDISGQIWTVTTDLKTFNVQQLSDSSSDPIGTITGATGMIATAGSGARIYARDVNNSLWVIRQVSEAQGTPPQFGWSQFHPLGDECAVLATGCTMSAPNVANTPPVDLFSLDSGYEVNVLSEDAITGALTDVVTLKPAGTNGDAEYVSRYVSELTVSDDNSSPQPGVQISITADQATGVWVGQTLYNVTPDEPVQLTTNQVGQITFAFFAGDLDTPTFSFSAPNLVNPPAVYPAQNVNDYLSGSAAALPGRPQFDSAGNTLSAATMQPLPDWEPNSTTAFVQPAYLGNTGAAASAITSAYTVPLKSGGQPGQWSPVDPPAGGLDASPFWHDLCKYPHDIMHAIKSAALTVSDVAVDVEQGVLQVTMVLANGMKQLMNLVIATFEDVVSAVKTAIRAIGRAVDDAIHWLKALFDWGDVINTKRVLKAGINGLMTQLATNLTDPESPHYAKTIFNTYYDEDVKDKVKNAFKNISSIFAQGKSLSTISSAAPFPSNSPTGPDALHPTNVSDSQTNNGTQTNYVNTHVTNYTGNGGTFPPQQMSSDPTNLFTVLYNNITENLVQNNGFQPMETVGSLQTIFTDPKSFADVAMYDIITAMEDSVLAILDIIEAVFDSLIDLGGMALTGFQDVMNKTIDIPIISWIYKKISGDPLSLLDLMCLCGAVPATIVYKLTFGMPDANPPFTPAQAEELENTYASNFPWPAFAGGSSGVSLTGALLGGAPFPGAGPLMVLNAVTYAIFDDFTDLSAYSAATTPTLAPDPITTFFSWASIVTTMVSQWLTAPFDIFVSQSTTAEQMTLALWSLNFIPVLNGLVFTVGSDVKKLAEFNQGFGLWLTCATGVFLFAMGIATSVEQSDDSTGKYNALYWVQNGIAPVPTAMKPLTIVGDGGNQPAGAIAIGVLLGCDTVMDIASGSLAFAEDAS